MKILHLSDTHGCHRQLKDLSEADVVVHSGDFTMVGTNSEAIDFLEWFSTLPYPHKIFICGNHDECLYEGEVNGLPPNVHYLRHSAVTIDGVKFWGMPLFMREAFSHNKGKWEALIAPDTDVLVSHAPPYGILDTDNKVHYGNRALLERVMAIRPRAHLFGHIHAKHGICVQGGTIFSNAAIMNNSYTELNTPNLIEI